MYFSTSCDVYMMVFSSKDALFVSELQLCQKVISHCVLVADPFASEEETYLPNTHIHRFQTDVV